MSWKALIAEFVGTFTLVFIGVGAIVSDQVTNGAVGLTGIALAFGLAMAVMVTATAATSGGHLNPAVSFGMLVSGNMMFSGFLGYVIAQCLGALVASSLLMSAAPQLELRAVNYGIPALGDEISTGMALITEIILTFILVFAVFGTAVDRRAPKVGGLFIGLAVTLDIFMGGPISGAAMNPARWLGPAIIGNDYSNAWVYWAGPLAGGALAAWLYSSVLQEK